MKRRTVVLTLVYLNIALLSTLAGILLASRVAHAGPVAATPTVPANPVVNVTYVDAPNLTCGMSTTALGCWDGGSDVRIVSGLNAPLHDWVLAHETAHVYGMTECAADDYAYQVTGNDVIYRKASGYAEQCGHA